jgi:hypothetical protein
MKTKIAITLDQDVLKLIREMANSEGRSISSQINKILKDFLSVDHSK